MQGTHWCDSQRALPAVLQSLSALHSTQRVLSLEHSGVAPKRAHSASAVQPAQAWAFASHTGAASPQGRSSQAVQPSAVCTHV
jgi:hypothetical protein